MVLSRQLYHGDVGLWNLSTNATAAFTVPVSNVPGLTNYALVKDIFDGNITTANGTLSVTVNQNGFNLYRLRR